MSQRHLRLHRSKMKFLIPFKCVPIPLLHLNKCHNSPSSCLCQKGRVILLLIPHIQPIGKFGWFCSLNAFQIRPLCCHYPCPTHYLGPPGCSLNIHLWCPSIHSPHRKQSSLLKSHLDNVISQFPLE